MSHIFAFVPTEAGCSHATGTAGSQLLARFKDVPASLIRDDEWVHLTLAPRLRQENAPFARDASSGIWLSWTGTWVYLDDIIPAMDGEALVRRYLEVGADQLGLELQGQFTLIIGEPHRKELIVMTDRCGSLHFFYSKVPGGLAVCSSSAVLSGLLTEQGRAYDQFDPEGLHQFIATGSIYGNLTLWANVRKIAAGTVCRINPQGISQHRYWHFKDINPETYNLDESVELTLDGITRSVRQIANVFPRIVSDLTGGYDSRALLCGLLNAKLPFETTVTGPSTSPDVQVSKQIARAFSLRHTQTEITQAPTAQELIRALRWTDGEYDMFEYSNIAAVHTKLSENYAISLNGSFGEIARGYWWELIWPGLTKRTPLSAEMLSQKRFAAIPYSSAVFSPAGKLDLRQSLTDTIRRTLAELGQFPLSSQMDALYYYERMGHWQGRIVSCTNQIWPCLSPYSFPQTLVPIFQTKADARIRSRLIRYMFERHQPTLASIPLEHGYPPRPLTLSNFSQFSPLLGHYAHRVEEKLSAKWPKLNRCRAASAHVVPKMHERYPTIFAGMGLGIEFDKPLLLESGMFDEPVLRNWFDANAVVEEGRTKQWRRLVTVEALLHLLNSCK